MSLKEKLNGNSNKVWSGILIALLSVTTFSMGYTIGAYKALAELKPLIVETSTEVKNLKERVNVLTDTMTRHVEVTSVNRK